MKVPLGFRYASLYAGIRKKRKDDLALVVSEPVASAAAVFTTNQVQAAPVRLGRRHLKVSGGRVRALLINAGNANCATRTGDRVARETCRAVAKALRVPVSQVLPSSTGVIGVELDAALITSQIDALTKRLSIDRLPDVADAIMTTDTLPKMAFREVALSGGTARIAGTTKGAGMIQPNMATTLAFVFTDAILSPAECREALVPAVEASYHRLTVDGDTSTNDTVLLMANGASGIKLQRKEKKRFQEELTSALSELAAKIARDGEGARKLITIEVAGATDNGAAARIARSIANSPLVKTAVAGEDANWGRILVAAGYAGVPFDPSKVDIYLQDVRVCRGGLAAPFDEKDMEARLGASECLIRFVIRGKGTGEAHFWTCDLTEAYVHINADYRT